MRHVCRSEALILAAGLLLATPAAAQNVRDDNVRAQDIPIQPLRDLDLVKDDVPPLLVDVANDPYSAEGLQDCGDIEHAITDLDTMLGDDVDILQKDKSDMQKGANSAGRIAKSFIGGLIPFRGVIRELSGSRDSQREFDAMVSAALIRREFPEGPGPARECPWPARPAEAMVEYEAPVETTPPAAAAPTSADAPARSTPTFVSRPVVQGTK